MSDHHPVETAEGLPRRSPKSTISDRDYGPQGRVAIPRAVYDPTTHDSDGNRIILDRPLHPDCPVPIETIEGFRAQSCKGTRPLGVEINPDDPSVYDPRQPPRHPLEGIKGDPGRWVVPPKDCAHDWEWLEKGGHRCKICKGEWRPDNNPNDTTIYNPRQPFHYPPAVTQQHPAEFLKDQELATLRIKVEDQRKEIVFLKEYIEQMKARTHNSDLAACDLYPLLSKYRDRRNAAARAREEWDAAVERFVDGFCPPF